MRDVYTAVLYRPEGNHICDSLHEVTSNSDYNIFSSFDKEALIERVVKITSIASLNAYKYPHYEEYEITFLFNGFSEQGDLSEEIDEIYEIKSNIDLLYDMWCVKHDEYFEKAKLKHEIDQCELIEAIAAAQVRSEELELFKHLSEKYKDLK